jgi:hypothetical protein
MSPWKTCAQLGHEEGLLLHNKDRTPREEHFVKAHTVTRSSLNRSHPYSASAPMPVSARDVVQRAGLPYTPVSNSSLSFQRDYNNLTSEGGVFALTQWSPETGEDNLTIYRRALVI